LASPFVFDMTPVSNWTEPDLPVEPEPQRPVLVTVEYRVAHENHDEFRRVMQRLGRSRRRTGAERWGLYQDAAEPNRFVEEYQMDSWEEHLRQHRERQTRLDEQIERRALDLVSGSEPPRVRHLVFAYDA
jgi:quinol monooxygenase YgiN